MLDMVIVEKYFNMSSEANPNSKTTRNFFAGVKNYPACNELVKAI